MARRKRAPAISLRRRCFSRSASNFSRSIILLMLLGSLEEFTMLIDSRGHGSDFAQKDWKDF